MEKKFVVKTAEFEGPLELLLDLIEKRKLHINSIALAAVTDDYIAHIKALNEFPVGDAAHFVLIASTLLLIKSKSLLPNLSLTEDEQGNIEDLEARLKLYQRFRELAKEVIALYGRSPLYARYVVRTREPIFSPPEGLNVDELKARIDGVLFNLPKTELVPSTTVKKVISLDEMIDKLTERVTKSFKTSFREFANMGKTEKVEVVVSFLALLELVKRGIVDVRQDEAFSDILMETGARGIAEE